MGSSWGRIGVDMDPLCGSSGATKRRLALPRARSHRMVLDQHLAFRAPNDHVKHDIWSSPLRLGCVSKDSTNCCLRNAPIAVGCTLASADDKETYSGRVSARVICARQCRRQSAGRVSARRNRASPRTEQPPNPAPNNPCLKITPRRGAYFGCPPLQTRCHSSLWPSGGFLIQGAFII